MQNCNVQEPQCRFSSPMFCRHGSASQPRTHCLPAMQNRVTKKPAYEEDRDLPGEAEPDKAERLWSKYLCMDNSPITDLFGGQLQSTVHCHKCKGNFTTYEPFWDLSLPIVKEGKGGLGAWFSGKSIPTTIQDCLQAFTADEVLQVWASAYTCICVCSKDFTCTVLVIMYSMLPRPSAKTHPHLLMQGHF